MPSADRGLTLLGKAFSNREEPEMVDLSNYSAYDEWLNVFAEASARLDALDTALTQVRHLCEGGRVSNKQILEVLKRQGV